MYNESYTMLKKAVTSIKSCEIDKAKKILDDLNEVDDIQTAFFVGSLKKRIKNKNWKVKNLYLGSNDGQQLDLYNFMSEKFPLVKISQEIVSEFICNELYENDNITLFDIGIGTGQQCSKIIKKLYISDKLPNKINIIGVDPSKNSLRLSKILFDSLATKYQIKITFDPICKTMETITPLEWEGIYESVNRNATKTLVNASFSLHHIPLSARDTTIQKLRNMNPALLTLIEPYADYTVSDLVEKFDNAWEHYALTFKALDNVDEAKEKIELVKSVFFGSEILDVFSDNIVELYETADNWVNRFYSNSFKQYNYSVNNIKNISNHPLLTINQTNTYIALNVDNRPVVTVGAFTT